MLSTARKLESFKKNYLRLQRKEDQAVITKIDGMVKEIYRRCNTTFLADVEAKEASSGMSLVFSMAPGYRDLYKYYLMLLRGLSIAGDTSVNETDAEPGFKYDDKTIIMENGDIVVLKDGTKIEQISIETFIRKPRESMRMIAK